MMDLQSVSKDLEARIDAGRAWTETYAGSQMPGPLVRSRTTTVQLKEFLNSLGRAERYGLGFIVTVAAPKQPISFQVNIRIKPTRTAGPKDDSYPYIVSYLVDQASKKEILISPDHIKTPETYAAWVRLGTEEWYLRRLAQALGQADGKLFAPEVRIPG